jgi:AsmA protein
LLEGGMARAARWAAYVALGIAALASVAAAVMRVRLDPAALKPRVEQAATRALGMEARVNGALALRWRPQPHLVLHDVQVRQRGAAVAAAREVVLGMPWASLFGGEPRVRSVAMHDGTLTIVRERDGRFNFQSNDAPAPQRPARDLPDVTFSRTAISYADVRRTGRIEGRACRGELRGIHVAGGEGRLLARLSLHGDAACAEVRAGDVVWADASTNARAEGGVLELQPLRAHLFDAPGSGRVRADFRAAQPAYRLEHTLQRVPVQRLLKALSLRPAASGRADVRMSLEAQGRSLQDLQRSMSGTLSLRGESLTYHAADLDARLQRFESSQNFNLFDVGTLFLAGPAGLIVTKGVDLASAQQGAQGRSEIRLLVSDWKVERGVARTQDVALATPEHRVALAGRIDLAADRFDGMTIALVDAKGCAQARRAVRGPLRKPEIEQRNAIDAITGPAVRLIKKGAELVGADSCEVFYDGAVPAPSPK